MHRFYIAPETWNASAPILRGSEAHHARDVLRLKRGDKAVLFNGRGRELTAEVTHLALGMHVSTQELKLPEGVTVRLPPEQTLIAVVAPEKEEVVEAVPGAAAAAPGAVPTVAGAAPAAPGAAPAPGAPAAPPSEAAVGGKEEKKKK